MKRTLEFHITEKENNIPIGSFLKSMGFSTSNLIALKKDAAFVLVNQTPAYMKQPLSAGDLLTIHIVENGVSEKIPPVSLPLSIVYEDEDILVVNKPSDMPIHPSMKNYENTLANAVAYYYKKQNKPFIFRCINRLDRNTTGLTIIAKHMVSAGILSSMVARREIHREYMALVSDTPSDVSSYISKTPELLAPPIFPLPDFGTVNLPLGRMPDSAIARCIDQETGAAAVTHYKILAHGKGTILLSLHLETGRTHQIRVHMASLGYPLLGDSLYGGDTSVIKRQALHSCHLSFLHPITKEPMQFDAKMPYDMIACVGSSFPTII